MHTTSIDTAWAVLLSKLGRAYFEGHSFLSLAEFNRLVDLGVDLPSDAFRARLLSLHHQGYIQLIDRPDSFIRLLGHPLRPETIGSADERAHRSWSAALSVIARSYSEGMSCWSEQQLRGCFHDSTLLESSFIQDELLSLEADGFIALHRTPDCYLSVLRDVASAVDDLNNSSLAAPPAHVDPELMAADLAALLDAAGHDEISSRLRAVLQARSTDTERRIAIRHLALNLLDSESTAPPLLSKVVSLLDGLRLAIPDSPFNS